MSYHIVRQESQGLTAANQSVIKPGVDTFFALYAAASHFHGVTQHVYDANSQMAAADAMQGKEEKRGWLATTAQKIGLISAQTRSALHEHAQKLAQIQSALSILASYDVVQTKTDFRNRYETRVAVNKKDLTDQLAAQGLELVIQSFDHKCEIREISTGRAINTEMPRRYEGTRIYSQGDTIIFETAGLLDSEHKHFDPDKAQRVLEARKGIVPLLRAGEQ